MVYFVKTTQALLPLQLNGSERASRLTVLDTVVRQFAETAGRRQKRFTHTTRELSLSEHYKYKYEEICSKARASRQRAEEERAERLANKDYSKEDFQFL
ncbi:unnamed protein product, partial [Anisakis simplex]|uniref:DUF3510 domain-containing protein n=1 Tax=Anisakis simplex TaxID=6269 RepID=A0A0M3JQK5_ANISI